MSEIETKKQIKTDAKLSLCYNCGIKIKYIGLKRCPNCKVILDPNNYINWRYSFLAFLCLLFLVPILIVILITIFHN